MSRKPGRPSIDPIARERFREAANYLLTCVSSRSVIADLQRFAAGRGHKYSSAAWSNQLAGTDAPSQEMQYTIAALLRVLPDDIASGTWKPGDTTPEDSSTWSWRKAVRQAAEFEGFTPSEVAEFFRVHPERGRMHLEHALRWLAENSGKKANIH